MVEEIAKIVTKEDFIKFLYMLTSDYKNNNEEWVNQSIPEYLERIAAWIDDYSQAPVNDIDWTEINYRRLAQILYVGKIYE